MIHPQLQIFRVIAEQGSFTKAGAILHFTPTALMKQMNQLEARIGAKLFERTNHGIKLTQAGEVFLDEAKSLIEHSQLAIGRVMQKVNDDRILKVGASLLNPYQPFLSRWQALSSRMPSINLTLVPFDDDRSKISNVIHALGSTIDLFTGVCDSHLWLDSAQVLHLDDWSIVCAIPRAHELANKPVIEMDDLKNQNIMTLAHNLNLCCDPARAELEEAGAVVLDAPHYYDLSIFNKCAEKNYLLLSLTGWRDVHPGFVLRTIRWKKCNIYKVPFGVIYSLNPSELTLAVVEQLRIATEKQI